MSSVVYIDPSFDASKLRAEFRIPPSPSGVYKNDMRILNIGQEKTNNGNSTYNSLVGGLGCIRSIEIYNGAQLLDQIQQFNIYTGVKNLLHPNDENMSVHRQLTHNKLGYLPIGDDTVTTGAFANGVFVANNAPDSGNEVFGDNAANVDKPRNGTWLDLSDCSGFIRSSPYIPMNVYSDLRIVITYVGATQLAYNIIDQNATTATLRPLLVCEYEPDVRIGEALMRQYQGVSFESVEWDQLHLPINGAGADVLNEDDGIEAIAKGFNNKYISKVIIVNTATDSASWITGTNSSTFANVGSVSQLDWQYQARVNGVNVFPGSFKEGKMRILGTLCDIWGDQNVTFGQNWCGTQGGAVEFMEAGIRGTVGQAGYSSWRIDDVVQEMKVSCYRTAVGKGPAGNATDNNGLRQALSLNIFGISRKQIIPTDSGLIIRYV